MALTPGKLNGIITLIEILIPLIQTAEKVIGGKGQGKVKAGVVAETAATVVTVADEANILSEDDAAEARGYLPLVPRIIDGIVGIFNSFSLFDSGDEEAAQED